jgi:predicted permease
VLGGAAGLLLARFGVQGLATFLPQAGYNSVFLDLSPDWRVLGFTMVVALLTGVLFGLTPALQAARRDFVTALKDEGTGTTGSQGRHRLRRGLVVLQVALSLMLLIGAGLFARSLGNLRALDLGFEPANVVAIEIDPFRYGYNSQRIRDYFDRLAERTRTIAGVRSVALAGITPLAGSRWNDSVTVLGYEWKQGDKRYVDHNGVGPGFFATTGIPILLGRDFRPEDNPVKALEPPAQFRPGVQAYELEGPRVAIVNQAFVKKFLGLENPIGRRFSRQETYHPEASYEIVGVVKDAKYFGLRKAEEPLVYIPMWRTPARGATLLVRGAIDPSAIVDAVRREAQTLDAAIPIIRTRTLQDHLDSNMLQERFLATLCSFFGILALLLAAIGLYGVMASSVTRRTREIGIRMALGAPQGKVLRMVMREAVLLLVIGSVIAVPAALAVTRLAESLLYGVKSNDPVSIAAAAGFLLAVGLMAALLPARKASAIDPLRALRHE